MASPGAPTGLAAPRGVGGTQPRGLGPRGAPEGGAVGRLDAWGLRRRGGGRCDVPCALVVVCTEVVQHSCGVA